jgi:MFS family permease
MSTKKGISTYAWAVVGLLWVVAMLNYLDRLLLTSMHDPIKESIQMTDAQFGLLTSVFLWVYGFLSPFGGYFADRYSRKLVIVFSVLVWSAVTLWTGFVHSFGEMLAARALMGVSEACYIPAALALITDYHKGSTRSLATGLHVSGLYAGMALGGVGGYIAQFWGWRYGFHIFGGFGIAYAIFLMFFLKNAAKEEDQPQELESAAKDDAVEQVGIMDTIRDLFGSRSFWVLLFYNAVLGMSFWLVNAWLPTFLKEQFNLSLGEAGVSATGYIQVASFIGVIVGGILADRWSRRNVRGRLYMPIIGFTLGAPCLYLMATTGLFGVAIAGMVVFGLARGFHDSNLMPIMCQVVDKRFRATGYGVLNFLSTITGGLMIYIGGAMKDANFSLSFVFQISAVGMLIASWFLFAVKPNKNND